MKIALLTWTYINYGTQLQAYSMCTYLKNNGQDVDFINYLTRKEDVIRYGKKNLSHQIKRVIKKSKQISLNRRMAKIGDDNIEALKNRLGPSPITQSTISISTNFLRNSYSSSRNSTPWGNNIAHLPVFLSIEAIIC